MTLGEKISAKRKSINLSQEQLGKLIGVSRSAIAKGESDGGIPDIENLKRLSQLFGTALDDLLNEGNGIEREQNSCGEKDTDNILEKYYLKKCNIDLTGWNDGIFEGYILGEDTDFVFYLIQSKREKRIGLLRKKLITKITLAKVKRTEEIQKISIDRQSFLDKRVDIYLFSGKFFDFSENEYLDVDLKYFDGERIMIAAGYEIDVNKVVKIEAYL